ncbi:MAG: prephenate dehydratase [Nitrososphaerales archaeon]
MTTGLRVAFQGERGAYSEMAALKHFGSGIELAPHRTFSDVFEAVESGKVDHAIVPIENSTEGSVNETYDLLLNTGLMVGNEVYLRVVHCLIGYSDSSAEKVRAVYSHPQALGQCRTFIKSRGFETVPFYDTAGSVKMLKELKMKEAAAIAGERAAEIYGMEVLERGIEDNKNNYTRFLVLGKSDSEPTGEDKTLMIFATKHLPGALHQVIEEFASRKINLTMIVSRPTKEKPWEYNFYVDFEGHRSEQNVKECLEELKDKTSFMKVLGSYPKFREATN